MRALKAGATGYLTKDSAPDELVAAIRQVARGERYVTQSMAKELTSALGVERDPHEILSDREYQVMCLLAAGKTATEVATDLSLSVKTISTYRSRVLRKLRLETTTDVVRYALEHGLIE
jgi:DNA-binding NarL/FixJ family response regulator